MQRTIGLFCVAIFGSLNMLATPGFAQQYRTYFGTYTTGDSKSKGIYTASFDSATGTLSDPVLAAPSANPSFLAIDAKRGLVFAVNEISEGEGRANATVSAFRMKPDGMLQFINSKPSHGGAPCHCNIDATGKFLLIANYVGGNLAVYPIAADGSLEDASCIVNHEGSSIDRSRQQGPHAHSINLSSDNRFAYAADLGTDKVMIYRFDENKGTLQAASPDSAAVTPGAGPRHFSLHPTGKFAYTNHELTAMVTGFSRDTQTGALTPVSTVSTLPKDAQVRKSTAECLVHPNGRFLYVSNRGHDSIACYKIDQSTGEMTLVAITSTQGQEPRNFVIDPTGKWLLAANQNSDTIVVFAIDQKLGSISPTDNRIEVGRPVCVRMLVHAAE
ncbi:MAG TPA: 6-phosphogluconolactonase [Planctomycetaceae bacterium]|nr:6-phosphogluconolactonase [Planctomycetaceae bacterium]